MALSLSLFLGLAPQAAQAAARVAAPARPAGMLEWAWTWLTGWFGEQEPGGGPGLARVWAKATCGIDPDGRCVSANPDATGGIDPKGRPVSVTGDAGMGSDPDGGH